MDQIANMLIMMKNASMARKETVVIPHSNLKNAILACLKKEGFVADFAKKTKKGLPVIEITLAYNDDKPKISDVARISKQSRRVYYGMKDIHTVRSGTGILVLSTPKGILTGRDARKEQVGGEALFRMW